VAWFFGGGLGRQPKACPSTQQGTPRRRSSVRKRPREGRLGDGQTQQCQLLPRTATAMCAPDGRTSSSCAPVGVTVGVKPGPNAYSVFKRWSGRRGPNPRVPITRSSSLIVWLDAPRASLARRTNSRAQSRKDCARGNDSRPGIATPSIWRPRVIRTSAPPSLESWIG
jgi:hypothetical protein